MTGNPYASLSALRGHVENTAAWLAIWEARNEPDAHARRCASDASTRSTERSRSCTRSGSS